MNPLQFTVPGKPIAKKRCYKCRKVKDISQFSKNRSKNDGLSSECKICGTINCKDYRINQPEKYKAASKKSYLKNRENVLKRAQEYYYKNQFSILKEMKATKQANTDWFYENIGGAYCRICKYSTYKSSLQLHHLDNNQKESSEEVLSNWLKIRDRKKLFNKIYGIKFTILCANCHSALHTGELNLEPILPVEFNTKAAI